MGADKDSKESVFTRGEDALSEKDAERLFDEINQAHLPYFMNVAPQDICIFLPHCLKSRDCPASTDDEGVHCEKCGRCAMATLVTAAEEAGVRVVLRTRRHSRQGPHQEIPTQGRDRRGLLERDSPRL